MSAIQNKVDASARALKDLEQCHADGKRDNMFIFWLRSRQDIIDTASQILADDTINDPIVLKEHLTALFTRYADDSTTFSSYCKNKIGENLNLLQQNTILEAKVEDLEERQAPLLKSVDFHREELRIHRLDAADLESAIDFQKKRFSAMKYYYDRQQRIRDKAHDRVIAETQARLEALQTEHDSHRAQHENTKFYLAEAQKERDALWEQAAHAAGLEAALEAAYETNERLMDHANSLASDYAPAAITEEDMVDLMPETEGDIVDLVMETETDDSEKVKEEEADEDPIDSSMTLVPHSLSSPSRSLFGIEWI
ncbi:uncharacterized protein PG986_010484 [Apiospora aurea]|uniref:Uncharacterized protein n=1 Tax=Apiospora aurea TaxID=335848 RepID=A0ABR1Q3L6_9PEZI